MRSVEEIREAVELMNKGKIVIAGTSPGDIPLIENLGADPDLEMFDDIPFWVKTVVVTRDNNECVLCGRPDIEIAHIVTSKVGDADPGNLILLCVYHHRETMHMFGIAYDYAPYVELG